MPSPEKLAEARTLFESGIAHFDRAEWSAALADFLRSRELYPTKSATKNAAVCFRKEGRFDEALETFEALLRDFPDLAPGDRAFAEKEIADLRGSIGSIEIDNAEPGASIIIDSRARGAYPVAPLRVSAGSHVIRVYKEGFSPFERRVDVAGRQVAVVDAHLAPLTRAGRLSVTETSGKALEVVVDNVVVGKTPWEGSIAVGGHTVALRGEGNLGTQPAMAAVRLGDVTNLSLAAEPLTSILRVSPIPAGATVSIDAVVVGQGVWEGKLREGEHKLEVAAEGFVPRSTVVRLTKDQRQAIEVSLDRDLSSPLWRAKHPARIFAEADAGPIIGLTYGGDVRSSGSADVPFGFAGTVRGGYELSSGITLGLDAGWMIISAGVTDRPTQLIPKGLPPDVGTADDTLALRGFRFGPSAGLRLGDDWPVTFRFGAGVFIGTALDARTAHLKTQAGAAYDARASQTPSAIFAYLAPEVRVARPIGQHVEVSLGVSVLAMLALDRPSWERTGPLAAAPPGQQGDGLGTFPPGTITGATVVGVVPSAALRYAF
jgi:hypothetical protein